jgi:hypothetical protein
MHNYSIHSNNHAYLQHNSSSQYPNQHDFVFVVETRLHMTAHDQPKRYDYETTKTLSDSKEDAYNFSFRKLLFITTENVFHYRMNEVMNKRSKP